MKTIAKVVHASGGEYEDRFCDAIRAFVGPNAETNAKVFANTLALFQEKIRQFSSDWQEKNPKPTYGFVPERPKMVLPNGFARFEDIHDKEMRKETQNTHIKNIEAWGKIQSEEMLKHQTAYTKWLHDFEAARKAFKAQLIANTDLSMDDVNLCDGSGFYGVDTGTWDYRNGRIDDWPIYDLPIEIEE